MEKIISSELTKWLLILGGSAVALYALLVRFISKSKGGFKPYQKETIIYILLGALLFAVIGISSHPAFSISAAANLIILQIYFLLLGIVHLYFIRNTLKMTTPDHDFLNELIFSCIVGCLGAACFLIVYRKMNSRGFEFIMMGSILFFILPLLVFETFRKAINVPPKVLKKWYYPVQQDIEEPEDNKLKNLIVISFEFLKDPYDNTITNFRAKAPMEMEFGELFYYFINDYNERNQNSRIQFVDDSGKPYGWIFYRKNKLLSLFTNYIDGETTIRQNKIIENDVIICERVLI